MIGRIISCYPRHFSFHVCTVQHVVVAFAWGKESKISTNLQRGPQNQACCIEFQGQESLCGPRLLDCLNPRSAPTDSGSSPASMSDKSPKSQGPSSSFQIQALGQNIRDCSSMSTQTHQQPVQNLWLGWMPKGFSCCRQFIDWSKCLLLQMHRHT